MEGASAKPLSREDERKWNMTQVLMGRYILAMDRCVPAVQAYARCFSRVDAEEDLVSYRDERVRDDCQKEIQAMQLCTYEHRDALDKDMEEQCTRECPALKAKMDTICGKMEAQADLDECTRAHALWMSCGMRPIIQGVLDKWLSH
eukprot:TRINITY_DN49174_c0_g1_i1.p1 TRINITY_DN49174_c0_g1~~TRINITY_DN49174_c0_g1_i1.p1  ORF type:complete len:146 (+),score=38.57 TRINITY_DN49174_c0_g1_i1:2-439(+)